MCDEHLALVVPKENKTLFLPEFHDHIMCLSDLFPWLGKGNYRAQYYSSVSSLNIRLVIPGLVGKIF